MRLQLVRTAGRRAIGYFVAAAALGFFVLISEVALKYFEVPVYLLPRPSQVINEIIQHFGYYLTQTSVTMLEAASGFLVGNTIAYGLALFFVRFPSVEKMGLAAAVAVKSTPIVVLAPLFIIWFGNGLFGKCLMAALICFFPMLVNSTVGLRSVDPDILNYLRSLGATPTQTLLKVRIQTSLPYALAAAKASSTISIVGAIVAELAGSDAGVGYIFLMSIYRLETEKMFAAIAFVAIAGVLFYSLVSLPTRVLSRHGWGDYTARMS
ncbi:MAG: ABC transporter permease [Candidatus Lernaella stagnicola]|nr:ABC transporter permease [Candidatus Lernaella stagnicola]